jgi:organic radical activating enzyme
LQDQLFEYLRRNSGEVSEVDFAKLREQWNAEFGYRRRVFSPVPESLDISITDACGLGCSYCYQNSGRWGAHAAEDLIERVLKDFDEPPYQIAIGGGEPTEHPKLPDMLLRAKELGTVPNYCTNGAFSASKMESLIQATNEACGSVAVTFHGATWDSTAKTFNHDMWNSFTETYSRLQKLFKIPLNVHLIVDCDAVSKLEFLIKAQKNLGNLRVLLLAYCPNVGRASLDRLITKPDYNEKLPEIIKLALDSGMNVGFSEGLLPYFLSRPEIGVNTDFVTRSSGDFRRTLTGLVVWVFPVSILHQGKTKLKIGLKIVKIRKRPGGSI